MLAAVRPGPGGRRIGAYLGGMIASMALGLVWMAMHAEQTLHVWIGWIGFTLGLAGMLALGTLGILRSPEPIA